MDCLLLQVFPKDRNAKAKQALAVLVRGNKKSRK
jgi:hypothetical protein